MKYFFPKLGKTVEAESIEEAKANIVDIFKKAKQQTEPQVIEILKPKKEKNVGKNKKTTGNK